MQPEAENWRIVTRPFSTGPNYKTTDLVLVAMSFNPGTSPEPELDAGLIACGNCRTPMPQELRFCRNCGFRLGEGTAEYTETVRFPNSSVSGFGMPPGEQPLARYGMSSAVAADQSGKIKKRKRISGVTWMFIGLIVFFVLAAAFTALIQPIRQAGRIPAGVAMTPRSYVGVDDFDNAEGGGVTFSNVEPPGGPADKAGLVGGDVIKKFDGQDVTDDDQIRDLLARTPIGKTVEVVYVRDGETKTTQLTTLGEKEFNDLISAFRRRPQGHGRFGYDDDETERVAIEGTNLFGIRLDSVSPSLPADMAGIKEGDIVIEFDKIPIRTVQELTMRVRRAIPYETVEVVVMRGGERKVIPVKMGRQ